MKNWILGFLFTLGLCIDTGCHPGGLPELEPWVLGEVTCAEELPPPEAAVAMALWPEALVEPYMPRVVRLTPDSELVELFEESAHRYRSRLGLEFEFVNDGIEVVMEPEIPWKDGYVDALARYQKLCVFDQCNDPAFEVSIIMSEAVVLGDKAWAGQQTSDHELGHIVTAWGHYRKQLHLPEGNLMAPGCRNHVCSPWTEADAEFLCEVAPCTKIAL